MADKQTAPIQSETQSREIPKPVPFDPWISHRRDFTNCTLDDLADYASMTTEHSPMGGNVYSEIKRRDMVLQVQTLEATLKAAKASEDAAHQSRRNATWMMWSVLAATVSASVAAASVVLPLFGFGR